jgi:hypothetical protein
MGSSSTTRRCSEWKRSFFHLLAHVKSPPSLESFLRGGLRGQTCYIYERGKFYTGDELRQTCYIYERGKFYTGDELRQASRRKGHTQRE